VQTRALNDFFTMLRTDPLRAFYGYRHIEMANENAAIDKLLISDSLFRSTDPRERRKFVDLVESVRENGGEVFLFSSLHVSGEQLGKITGIAAILRFPLPDLEDVELEDDSDDDDDADDSKLGAVVSPGLDLSRDSEPAEAGDTLADQLKEDLGF